MQKPTCRWAFTSGGERGIRPCFATRLPWSPGKGGWPPLAAAFSSRLGARCKNPPVGGPSHLAEREGFDLASQPGSHGRRARAAGRHWRPRSHPVSEPDAKTHLSVGLHIWRRERDSNPRRDSRPSNDLANRPLQPLGYLSGGMMQTYIFTRVGKMVHTLPKLLFSI